MLKFITNTVKFIFFSGFFTGVAFTVLVLPLEHVENLRNVLLNLLGGLF